jgi:HK97 family phage major capsid protein
VTPRYASRAPSRGNGTSFQRFRAESLDLSDGEKAFWNYALLPSMEDRFEAERMLGDEYRVLSKATSGGGFLVPTDLAGKITAAARAASTVAQLATEIVTDRGSTLNVALDAALGAAAWLAENASYTPVDDTLTQVQLGAFKGSTKILVSEELRTDNEVALDDYLAGQLGYRLGSLAEAAYCTGSGSGQPLGLVTAGNGVSIVTAAVGSTLLYKAADLLAVFLALPAAYRPTASWLIAADDFGKLAGTTDTAGQLAFPSLQFDPPSLFGRPVFISGYLPAPGVSNKSLVFGDFQIGYGIRRVDGVELQRQDELSSDLGQIGFRARIRVDGRVLVADALRILQHSAT